MTVLVKEKNGMKNHVHQSLLMTSFCLNHTQLHGKILLWGFGSRKKFKIR